MNQIRRTRYTKEFSPDNLEFGKNGLTRSPDLKLRPKNSIFDLAKVETIKIWNFKKQNLSIQ